MKNIYFLLVLLTVPFLVFAQLPETYDLRDVDGVNYVTSVKSQQGGTCWTHGTMASMEGNMLITNAWADAGETGEPALAEYHLDWWNGFNEHNNDDTDPTTGGGLEVHMGGDYRVSTAYFSRGEGATREVDGSTYNNPPSRYDESYHIYYPRTVEWYTMPSNSLDGIDLIKQMIIDHGVMATCMCYDGGFINNYIHYQPPTDLTDPNHSVAIIGWDDNLDTQAALPGAWLCKNSWGSGWGLGGYFWISYYDKHACRNIEMGAISFQEVEPMQYEKVFFHDYHGWRDQVEDVTLAANRFLLDDDYILEAVSFFSNAENITYTATIFETMGANGPENEIASMTGDVDYIGFHTFDFEAPVDLTGQTEFVIQLELSDGGMPYDRTSDIPVLLGAPNTRTIVDSYAEENQSYYYNDEISAWEDFYNYDDPSGFDNTGNFCIKGLCIESTVGISNLENTESTATIYPNPVNHNGTIAFIANENTEAHIMINDMSGRLVSKQTVSIDKGRNTIPFTVSEDMEKGFYTVRVISNNTIIARSKMIVR